VLVCAVAGGLLAFVNSQTSAIIDQQIINTTVSGIKAVTPESDNNPFEEQFKVALDGDSLTIYPAKKGGELVGYAVESTSHNGFSGDVRILVGIDNEGSVIDYTVLEQAETPGLGAHVVAWFHSDEHPTSDVRGKSLAAPLQVSKDGGDVDAITAATITSRAFLDAVNKAARAVKSLDPDAAATEPAAEPAEPVDVAEEVLLPLLPEHDNAPIDDCLLLTDASGASYTVYPATRGGIWSGAAITTETQSAFEGHMLILVSVDGGGHILDYTVLEESESEGIGDQVQTWFRDSAHPSSDIRGRSVENPLKLTQDEGTIDGITGATVTSRAFLDAVSRAVAVVDEARATYMDEEI
jgi:electron transport complex protein RnfG